MKKLFCIICMSLLLLSCTPRKVSNDLSPPEKLVSYNDKKRFIPLQIKRTLVEYNMYSEGTYKLLLGTAATESDFGKLNKQNGGPALGIFQMEPRTALDIWKEYLAFHPVLRSKVESTLWPRVNLNTQLRYNLKYQTIMAVVHYKRAEERYNIKMPTDGTKWSSAWFYKKAWNTHQGKGSTIRFFRKYVEYVEN